MTTTITDLANNIREGLRSGIFDSRSDRRDRDEALAALEDLEARAEKAEAERDALRAFAREVALQVAPLGEEHRATQTTIADLPAVTEALREVVAERDRADQRADRAHAYKVVAENEAAALRARAEAAEQRAEAAERELAQAQAERDEAAATAGFAAAIARTAQAEAERLRSAIAETLRLADIYAGVASHNAEAEPETAGEAWRSPYMATMRELRRAIGGAA